MPSIAADQPHMSSALGRTTQLLRASVLQRISVPASQAQLLGGQWGPWSRSFADSTFLDKDQVTERILGVVCDGPGMLQALVFTALQ